MKKGGESFKEAKWGRNRDHPVLTHQSAAGKGKEPVLLLGSSKEEAHTCCMEANKICYTKV